MKHRQRTRTGQLATAVFLTIGGLIVGAAIVVRAIDEMTTYPAATR